ncbi:MAG: MFS transporter [Reinekea sp.]
MKKLLTIYTLSNLSSWLDFLAVTLIVSYSMEAGVFTVALASIALVAPQFLFSRLFSHQYFTSNIRRTLTVTLLLRALITSSLLFIDSPALLLLIILPRSLLLGFFEPMFAALISRMQADTKKLASFTSLINTGSKLVAPAVGGAIAASYGENIVFGLGAFMCLLSGILTLIFVQDLNKLPSSIKEQHDSKDSMMPSKPPISDPFYVNILIPSVIYYFMVFAVNNLFPYLLNYYGAPKSLLGYCLSAASLGNAIVGFSLLRLKTKFEDLPFVPLITIVIATAFLVISFTIKSSMWVAIVIVFLMTGLFTASMMILSSRKIFSSSEHSPSYASSLQSIQSFTMMSSPILGALLVTYFGEDILMAFVSIVAIALTLLYWGITALKKSQRSRVV